MIDFYNAFISYKHAKLDISIAEHVQKSLEHFHVPHRLKKSLKHQKITRIFRDKDELPITSDLTETLTDALEKAEYLIVICSTNTKESIWVKREINTFLKTHTRDKILTVLCDGEPDQVIPEELLSEEKNYTDEMGNSHTIRVPIEPLSCDYRLPRRKADREELPRLASALLGCSYDELQRRRRQYRMRRAAAIAAVGFVGLTAFGAYMTYSKRKIDNSYIDSLRSRSQYLANESRQLLNDNKRTDAVHLALASLPDSPDSKMPVTASAYRAITDATAAYQSNAGINYSAIWNFKTERTIKKFILSDDREYLTAVDESGTIYCWNALSHQLYFKTVNDDIPEDILFMGKDSILVVFSKKLEAYNTQTGKKVWEYEKEKGILMTGYAVYAANSVYLSDDEGSVVRLSAKDGTVKDTYELKTSATIKTIYSLTVSSDGKKIAYTDSGLNYIGEDKIHVYDTETHKDSSCLYDFYYVWKISFLDNDHICLMMSNDVFSSSMDYNNFSYLAEGFVTFCCYDTNLNKKWDNELTYSNVMINFGMMTIPSRNSVTCYAGNAASILDIATGTVTNHYLTGSSIISVSDWNSNGLPEFICDHGEYEFAVDETNNNVISYDVLGDDIATAYAGDYIYIVEDNNNDIICFNNLLQDDEWEPVSGFSDHTLGSEYQAFYADENYLIIAARISETETNELRISVIDPKTAKLLSTTDISDVDGLLTHFKIDFEDDEYYGFFGYYVYTIDPKKGTVEKTDQEIDYLTSVSNGKLISRKISGGALTMEVSDYDGSHSKTFILEDINNLDTYDWKEAVYVEAANSVYLPLDNHVFVADLGSSKFKEMRVAEGIFKSDSRDFYATASGDGSMILLSDGHTVLVTDDSYKELYTLICQADHRFGALFKNGILYISENEYLDMYSGDTGTLISRHEMELYGTGESQLTFDERFQQLYLQSGSQISIFDMNTWTEIASIKNCYCYNEQTDRFFVFSYIYGKDAKPGYIKHYTLDELIDKAERYLNGQELDDITKTRYGL